MPRKAKEEVKNIKKETIKESKTTTKKETSNKKITDTKKAPNSKKTVSTKKTTNSKKTASTKKALESVDKVTAKKTSKKENAKNTLNKKNPSKKVSTKKVTTKKQTAKIAISEYYDLPYRYNQTTVKVLAQTPNTLFVYWDISDEDRKNYTEQYGPYFFNDTKPVLIVHNKTKNYDFEVDINDFANSWYLHLVDSNCEYEIELGRRPINEYAKIENYLPISNSNSMESPNDHILLDKLSHVIYFKNVKTNEVKTKTTLSLLKKIGKISSIAKFYQKLYPEEEINFTKLDLRNPSSSSFFK